MPQAPNLYKDHYVIMANRDYTVINMAGDPGFAELLAKEKRNELKIPNTNKASRAVYEQTLDMLYTTEFDEDDIGTTVFKEEVLVTQTDEAGCLFFAKGQEELCRKILRNLRRLDKSIQLDPRGLQLPEDRPEPSKGGRGKKKVK